MNDREKLKEIYEQLKAPFPPDAYKADSSRGFELTSIKAQYIVERLNDVLGLGAWELTGEYKASHEGVLFIGELAVKVGESVIKVQNAGYSEFKGHKIGDAYKSARTDCLSKCSSWLGLGNEVFKGNVKAPKSFKNSKYENKDNANNNYKKSNDNYTSKGNQLKLEQNKKNILIPQLVRLLSTYTSNWLDQESAQELKAIFEVKNLRDLTNRSEYGITEAIDIITDKLATKNHLADKKVSS